MSQPTWQISLDVPLRSTIINYSGFSFHARFRGYKLFVPEQTKMGLGHHGRFGKREVKVFTDSSARCTRRASNSGGNLSSATSCARTRFSSSCTSKVPLDY
jgi:hypothetical protein